MNWVRSWRCDPVVRALADRHYSRQTIGHTHFVPPGRCLVLRTLAGDAAWVTSWPFPEYARHGRGDAWVCTLFRNEGGTLSSELVADAVAATRAWFGSAPAGGMLTFVDERRIRRKRDPGRCFRRAGFTPVGRTRERDLLMLELQPHAMPPAAAALEFQLQFDQEEAV
jgi:hypothetical protein